MANPTIISMAILMVNYQYNKDKPSYLESFVPIIAECIRLSSEDVVSAPILQKDLQKKFGLTIPRNVLDTLLNRLRKRGYVKYEDKICKKIQRSCQTLIFTLNNSKS